MGELRWWRDCQSSFPSWLHCHTTYHGVIILWTLLIEWYRESYLYAIYSADAYGWLSGNNWCIYTSFCYDTTKVITGKRILATLWETRLNSTKHDVDSLTLKLFKTWKVGLQPETTSLNLMRRDGEEWQGTNLKAFSRGVFSHPRVTKFWGWHP